MPFTDDFARETLPADWVPSLPLRGAFESQWTESERHAYELARAALVGPLVDTDGKRLLFLRALLDEFCHLCGDVLNGEPCYCNRDPW